MEDSSNQVNYLAAKKIEKGHLNLVIIGDTKSGKSTTLGNLIYKLGVLQNFEIDMLEEEVVKMNKRSSKYAWVLDKLTAERERGLTTATTLRKLETAKYTCTFIHVPGHRDYIHDIVAATSMADCAILMIDSTTGGSEADGGMNSQTYEHALLAFSLGVGQIICCCNKMDATAPSYDQDTYINIMKNLRLQLKEIGYNKKTISAVPISGLEGDNLTDRSENMKWHLGATLMDVIDKMKEPMRRSDLALCLPLLETYKIAGSGVVAVGLVATGIVKPRMHVNIGPIGLTTEVKSLKMHGESIGEALSGAIIEIHIEGVKDLKQGFVLSNSNKDTAKETVSFTSKIIIKNHPGEIRNGYTALLHCHSSHITVKFSEILSKIDWESEKELEKKPQCLKKGDAGIVKMIPTKPMVVEPFSECPLLGRFAVRDLGKTVATGVIKSVEKKEMVTKAAKKPCLRKLASRLKKQNLKLEKLENALR